MTTTEQGVTEEATVKLTAGEAKATAPTFSIESSHAVQCAYTVIEASDAKPDGQTILRDGTSVEVNTKAGLERDGLKPNTA